MHWQPSRFFFFFFNDTATTEIYTLSLHDALPISLSRRAIIQGIAPALFACTDINGNQHIGRANFLEIGVLARDRKSTRLNSSHGYISYAVFCLKKKKKPRR